MKVRTIKINKRDRDKVEEFANLRCGEDQSLYKKRGSFKRDDILVGGLAEIAVYKLLRKHDFKVNKPDFTIHEKKKKSYGADLQDSFRHFHVKGQSKASAKKYGNSWLFQRHDKLTKQECPHEYIVPCEVCLDTNTVKIFGIITVNQIHRWNCWGECAVPSFRHSKLALYKESLDVLSNNAMWGILYRQKRS